MTEEQARRLVEAISDPQILATACIVCAKAIRDHSDAEVATCLRQVRDDPFEITDTYWEA